MSQLALWGHLPLYFFGSAWVAFIILLWHRFSRINDSKNYLLLAIFSGVLLSVGFPPLPGFVFMFVGFVPLLWIEHRISEEYGMARWQVFKFGMAAFITWNILTTYWVTNTLFMAGFLAIIPNSLLMSIPWVLFHFTKVRLGPRIGYSAFISYWMVFELAHLNLEDISWPWLMLGNSFARYPEIVQWYEITGAFGGSLWILVLNVLLFFLYRDWTLEVGKGLGWRKSLLPIIILVIPVIASSIRYHTYEDKGELAEVVVVQPNYEPHFEKFTVRQKVQVDHFIELSGKLVREGTDYLVFPETSFDGIRHNDILSHPTIIRLKAFVDNYPGLKLVTGLGSFYVDDGSSDRQMNAPRVHLSLGDTTIYESYNSAIQILSGSDDIPFYYKSKLVPGPELPPFASVTQFLEPIVRALGGTMAGLGTQNERSVFESEDGSMAVAPVICYESVFGQYVTGYINKGATAIFVVTNDGWWDNTAGHKQHLMFASLRAIETRRSIARSANTGISAFINQRGDISQATPYGQDAVIRAEIAMNKETTFYTKYGDLIARLALFWSAVALLMSIVKRRLDAAKKLNQERLEQ